MSDPFKITGPAVVIEAVRPPRILFPRLRQSHTEHHAQPARPIPVRILLPEHHHLETPGGRRLRQTPVRCRGTTGRRMDLVFFVTAAPWKP